MQEHILHSQKYGEVEHYSAAINLSQAAPWLTPVCTGYLGPRAGLLSR